MCALNKCELLPRFILSVALIIAVSDVPALFQACFWGNAFKKCDQQKCLPTLCVGFLAQALGYGVAAGRGEPE